MSEWIAKHTEFILGLIGSFVASVFGCIWYVRGYVSTIEQLKTEVKKNTDNRESDSARIRRLEDTQIGTEIALGELKELKDQSKENGLMLAKIAGKLEIE